MAHVKKSLFHSFLEYVSKNVLSMIGLSLYILADTFFISKSLGADGIAALNLILPVYTLLTALALLIGVGAATKYSILRAQGKFEEADRIYSTAIICSFLLGVVFTLIGIFGSGALSQLFGARGEVYTLSKTYLTTIFSFSIPLSLNSVFVCFVRNDGRPSLAMTAMLTGSIANIFLDYIFMFPLGWGMFGAAFATGLAPVIGLLLMCPYILGEGKGFHYKRKSLSLKRIREIFSFGLPSFVTEMSSGIVILVFNIIILRLAGNIGVAAYGVIANLALIVAAIFTGIGQGVQPVLSTQFGVGDQKGVNRVLRYGLVTAISVGILFSLLGLLVPDFLARLLSRPEETQMIEMATRGIRLYFLAFPFMSVNILLSSFFTCTEKPVQSFLVSVLRGGAAVVPFAFLLSATFGISGVWITVPAAEILTLLIALVFVMWTGKKATK